MKPLLNLKGRSALFQGRAEELLDALLPPHERVVVISDANLDRLHHSLLTRHPVLLIGQGETAKTLRTVEELYRGLIALGVDRSWRVVAIGGGIVTDVAGFAASTYMRGLRFGFVPTTLLSQVDASVGGKNGVNVDGYKNMAGLFNQPDFVICDASLLHTLPEREFRAGMAEVVKAAVIADAALFERLEQVPLATLRNDEHLLEEIVASAIRVKAQIVEADEREQGERRKLNLGHTLAHAIEKSTSKMNHGEAVAVGLHLATHMALRLGKLAPSEAERIDTLLRQLGFVLEPPVEINRLLKEVSKDKKAEGEKIHFVLPTSIGTCRVEPMTLPEIRTALGQE